jgi:Holliday junction resolvase
MNSSKRKGDTAERAVVNYLRNNGYPNTQRMRAGWKDDQGDITGVPDTCVEVKAEKRISLATYMDELRTEMANARTGTGVVVVKRRGAPTSDYYAVTTLDLWVKLVKESGR